MIKLMMPNEYKNSIFKIDFYKFYEKGYRAIIFDIDNTLAKRYEKSPDKKTINLLKNLENIGFSIVLLSNNSINRVKIFNKNLGYYSIHKAGKPKLKGIKKAYKFLNINKNKILLVGDQIFTDCICGNLFGVYTILVSPIDIKEEEWYVRLKRFPEKIVLKFLNKS